MPDLDGQFVLEVDVSNIGIVGIVLQRALRDQNLQPCDTFSQQLSLAEVNYDKDNRELLVVKMALEEWRHWL